MARQNPVYPQGIDMPFAANTEDKNVIPTSTSTAGQASLAKGFPVECSRILEDGGIPPKRTDMNGILHLVSSWAFYQQSGGIAKYDPLNNYITPAMVSHNGIIYTCLAANGPNSGGVKTPGTAAAKDHWVPGLGTLADNIYGNNANLYLTTGTTWIDDAQAVTNFPVKNVGGFLSVMQHGNIVHHAMNLRTNPNQLHVRLSTDKGVSWLPWCKALFTTDVKNGAYTSIFIRTDNPNDAIGADGDLWFQYI